MTLTEWLLRFKISLMIAVDISTILLLLIIYKVFQLTTLPTNLLFLKNSSIHSLFFLNKIFIKTTFHWVNQLRMIREWIVSNNKDSINLKVTITEVITKADHHTWVESIHQYLLTIKASTIPQTWWQIRQFTLKVSEVYHEGQ